MKSKLIMLLFLSFFGSNCLKAQEGETAQTFGLGYQIVQYQNDFGFGLNLSTATFAKDRLRVRLKTNLMFNQAVINAHTEWIPYSNVSIGVVGMSGNVSERLLLYGEGGIMCLLPSGRFSSTGVHIGGYGLFGFEFYFSKRGNYFIEIGGIGTGAVADRLVNKPIYSNGMTLSAGFRFFLK